MISKILLIAIMSFTYPNGNKDIFVFQQPEFDTIAECQTYFKNNSDAVFLRLYQAYPNQPPENIYCVPYEAVEEMIKRNEPVSKTDDDLVSI